jgi:hypothetical protein
MKICYKIVKVGEFSGELRSSTTCCMGKSVKYELNKWVDAPEGTRLFVFRDMKDIYNTAFLINISEFKKRYKLYKCQVKGGFFGYPTYSDQYFKYWEIINSLLKKKKSVTDFFERPLDYGMKHTDFKSRFPSYLVKAVKLIEEVNI